MDNKDSTLGDVLVNVACQDSATYKRVLDQFTEYDREALIDRKAKLIIAGRDGGIYNLRTTSFGIFREKDGGEADLTIWLQDKTLEDIVVFIAQRSLGFVDEEDPGTSPKEAFDHNDLMIKGRRAIYHASEIMDILDRFFFNNELVIKIAIKAYAQMKEEQTKEETKCKK